MVAVSGNKIIAIIRNVTGRTDANDPMFTDPIMLQYLNDFVNLEMPQDIRIYQNKTWYEFDLKGINDTGYVDPYPVDLSSLVPALTTIGPPAYIAGFETHWWQDPATFYAKWPETQTYTPQRPVDILYYNNELVFRAPPDQTYEVKIQAYTTNVDFTPGDSGEAPPNLELDYVWRYLAYGTALDIFADFGEHEQYDKYYPKFLRYRSLVIARTNQQLMTQRTIPNF